MSKHRLLELRALLSKANHEYHVEGRAETLTDEQFDALLRELVNLEADFPDMADLNSPSARIGGTTLTGFQKVRHGRRMLSLDNVFSAAEVLEFFPAGRELVVDPKVDGLSVSLVYVSGELTTAITRGNGIEGDDVTANVRTIRTVPLRLPTRLSIEVRGEVYMTHTAFEAANVRQAAQGDDLFANPRNAAAGTLKLRDTAEVAARRLSFVAHGTPTEIQGVSTQWDLVDYFAKLGFVTVRTLPLRRTAPVGVARVIKPGIALELSAQIAEMDRLRVNLDLPTDGLVFKLNDLGEQRELGEGTRSPKWAVAYKFPPERKSTLLKQVVLQVGRTGKITPVAEVDPVDLSGTVVRRASLCNQDEINRLKCNVGDVVWIEKSAEIIPKIVGVAQQRSKLGPFQFPQHCPSCHRPLTRPAGFVDFYCTNRDCNAQALQSVIYAAGKGALDIDGCGDAMAQHLVDLGVRDLYDLLTIPEKVLVTIKPAARAKFLRGRTDAFSKPLWRKIAALGIDGIGKGRAQDLAARFPDFMAAADTDVIAVIGEQAHAALCEFISFRGPMLQKLAGIGFHLREDAAALGPLSGKVFVITGTLLSGTRDEVIRKIEAAGGMVKNSVSAKVTFLVAGADCGARKSNDAKRLGVQVISEEDLYTMLGQPMESAEIQYDREI